MLKKEDYEPGLWTEEKNLTVEETRLPFTEELAGVIPQPEENREIPDGIQVVPAQNESYQNFIIRYSRNVDGAVNYESDRSFQIINELFGVIYIPASQVPESVINSYSYSSVPKCYTYMDQGGLNASGINRLHEHPYLRLRGAGTLIAIIDSGIDYTHSAFRNGNQSRIVSIWDQSLPSGESEEVPYGQVFTRQEINRALQSENPQEIVPSADINGHGTRLASIAAGNRNLEEGVSGAAPEAELVIVKLKPAKEYLRELYLIPPEAEVFQEDDIMLGISYAINAPCVIRNLCLCAWVWEAARDLTEATVL